MNLKDKEYITKNVLGNPQSSGFSYTSVKKAVLEFEEELKYYFEGKMENYFDKETKDKMINLLERYKDIFGEWKD